MPISEAKNIIRPTEESASDTRKSDFRDDGVFPKFPSTPESIITLSRMADVVWLYLEIYIEIE